MIEIERQQGGEGDEDNTTRSGMFNTAYGFPAYTTFRGTGS